MPAKEEIIGLPVLDGDRYDTRIIPVVTIWVWQGKYALAKESQAIEPSKRSRVARYRTNLDKYIC